ncbi:hypothetical protein Tco_0806800 [Tanacetum coccineum]
MHSLLIQRSISLVETIWHEKKRNRVLLQATSEKMGLSEISATVIPTRFKDEEPEVQGRKSQADPQILSKQLLVTPPTTKSHASGGNKMKNNPNTLEASKPLVKYSTAGENKGQREGKAPMLSEETPKKTKEQILQEEASLAEAIRLDSLQREEEAEQIHLDALLAQRIAEEEELTEQQKKRKAQVQFGAQIKHITNEDFGQLD